MPGRTEELQKAMEMFGADETVVTSSLRGLFNSQVTYGKRDQKSLNCPNSKAIVTGKWGTTVTLTIDNREIKYIVGLGETHFASPKTVATK